MQSSMECAPGSRSCRVRTRWPDRRGSTPGRRRLEPRDDVEQFLVGRAVNLSWQLDRAERARAARLAEAATGGAARLADLADEVIALGRRLFWDPLGPLPLYPHLGNNLGRQFVRFSWSDEIDDPNEPARIVNRLESTAMGCAWLLDRWGELRQRLEDGWTLQPPERLRAIRLLGRQPMDAPQDDRVMMIYLACWAMDLSGPHGFQDLVNELHPAELKLFIERLDDREAMERRPADRASGKAELLKIVAAEEERLEAVLDQHLERDETVDASLLFDGSEEGERLRRYEATCDRGLIRVLAALRQRRRDGEAGATATATVGARDNGRAASGPPEGDAVDRVARLARILSSMAGNGTVTNEANGHECGGCADPAPCEIEVAPAATNEANTPAGPTDNEPRTTDNGRESVTNEANGPAETTENGPRRTDSGQKGLPAMLVLLVLLFCAGLAAACSASLEVRGQAQEMKSKPQAGHELGRLRSPRGPSFFPKCGMNAFDRCHRNEVGCG